MSETAVSATLQLTICEHGVNRALQRCRVCEPDIYQLHNDGAVTPIEQIGPKLDRIIELLETLCSEISGLEDR